MRVQHRARTTNYKEQSERYPVINWGRGRLLAYESYGAFAGKFCRLNGIRPKEFRQFFEQFIRAHKKPVERFALLLDEDISIVGTSFLAWLDLPGYYGTFLFDDCASADLIRYCPECVKNGYHSVFHQMCWLEKCPIHGMQLHAKYVPFSKPNSYHDRFVMAVEQLLDDGCGEWPSIQKLSTFIENIDDTFCRQLATWIRTVHLKSSVLSKSNLISLDGANYSLNHLDLLLGRIAYNIPIPGCVTELTGTTVTLQVPTIVQYPTESVSKLAALLQHVKYDEIKWLYRMTTVLKGELPRYRRMVSKVIEELRCKDIENPCSWGRRIYGDWVAVDPDSWPQWQLQSQFQYALSELEDHWMEFITERDSSQARTGKWFCYRYLAADFVKHGYAILEDRVPSDSDDSKPWIPDFVHLVHFNFDSDLKELIEDLLYEEALSEINELLIWLKSIPKGTKPGARMKLPSRGNLFLEDDRAYLCTWPTEWTNST